MSVIINDFEIEIEPPAEQAAPAEQEAAPSPSPALRPLDIEDVLERKTQREARLRAH